ncbi:flagellinolysin [Massilibacterium senegalense]|uniref:flagellinolysin n=1 Tax=Massilibacterium senegalense TaxID=1632858 RepID=UPI0007857B73|nr:flagellinolysin [Massilibacterium senegalense]
MRVAHHLPALHNLRQFTGHQKVTQHYSEKLTSGARINKACDDAAGLAISEKMRGQIRGLHQASRNIQDSISLVQTAEGALQEIHSLLQRGRELSVQAANDTNTTSDREQIQQEIEQLMQEVDGISNRTEFNTLKLLRGTGIIPPTGTGSYPGATDGSLADKEMLTKALQNYMLSVPEQLIDTYYGIHARPNTPIEISYQNDAPGGAVAWVSSSVNTVTGEASTFKMVLDTADFFNDTPLWISKDRIVAHEMVHAVMGAAGINLLSSATPTWFKEGTAEYLAGADERLAGSIAILGSEQAAVDAISSSPNTSHFYSASYAAVKYLDHVLKANGSSLKNVMQSLADGRLKALDTALKEVTNGSGNQVFAGGTTQFLNDYKANGATFIRTQLDLDPSDGDSDGVGSITGNTNDADIIPDGDSVTFSENPLTYFTVNWASDTGYTPSGSPFMSILMKEMKQTASFGTLRFQIGANTGQTIEASIRNIDRASLGITNVLVTSAQTAGSAISTFDDAIQIVSTERASLGALQNRLEHALSITNASEEQMQISESRIRDADIAKEMMGYTKHSLLLQAAQGMLAQANQQPSAILQLLR